MEFPNRMKVAGVHFGDRKAIIKKNVFPKTKFTLEREPDNAHDKNAIRVLIPQGDVGYIPAKYAAEMAPLMDTGLQTFNAKFCSMIINEKSGKWVGLIITVTTQ